MAGFEYKVINAPRKPGKARGVKGFDDKYAHTLSELMNEMATDGWQYSRAESIPVDEKSGMMGKVTEKYLTLLIFQRALPDAEQEPEPIPTFLRSNETASSESTPEPTTERREPTLSPVTATTDDTGSDHPMRLNKPLSDDEFAENIRGLMDKEDE